jgi:hypothetical protein
MARYEFGGVMAAWIVSTVPGDPEGTEFVTLPAGPTTLEIYDAPDGELVADFIDENGNPTAEITIPDGDPYIPRFQGPDGAESLWVQAANGRWLPLPRWDDGSGAGGDPDTVKLSGGNVYEYEESNVGPWLVVRKPDDNSDSTDWPNMLEFQYWDNSTNRYRLGFHLNEKMLLRVRGVTPNDVAVRFMAHPNLNAQWPVMEVTKDNNAEKVFQVFERQVTSHVGVQVPFLVNPQGERLYFGTADPATDPAYADYRPNVGDVWLDFNGEA